LSRAGCGLTWLVLVGCTAGTEPVVEPAAALKPNVVLLTLDTTRADRLGAYGYEQAHTETLDALANAGTRFDRAYSPVPYTIPSHLSIFTGLYPPRHGVRDNGGGTMGPSHRTLTDLLKEQGYRTGASVAAFVTSRTWGFDKSFDAFFDDIPTVDSNVFHAERPAESVVDDAVRWWKQQPEGSPKFLWVHLYDPHFPFKAPANYAKEVEGRPYDGELAYVDDQVARLVDAVGEAPTLFVVVGDHGESLGEHGELTHGLFVYDATQRVPFFVSGPGIEAGVVSSSPVSLVDVLPVVCDALNLAVPESIDGRLPPHEAPIYMESWALPDQFGLAPSVGVVVGNDKLVDYPRPELYDVVADPSEQNNLAETRTDRLAELHAVLKQFGFEAPNPKDAVELDPEIVQQLEALGYAQGPQAASVEGEARDPKDFRALIGGTQRADRLRGEGKPEEAVELLARLVAEYPEMTGLTVRQLRLLLSLRRLDEAYALATAAHERDPDHSALAAVMANLLVRKGEFRRASVLFQRTAEEMPWAGNLRSGAVASLLASEGGRDEGLALGQKYLREHKEDRTIAGLVGIELLRRGQVSEAIVQLEIASLAARPVRSVCLHLGVYAYRQGRVEDARNLLEEELGFYPRNREALRAIQLVYMDLGLWKEVIEVVDRLRAIEDNDFLRYARAQALFNLKEYGQARVALDEALGGSPERSDLLLLNANLLSKEGHSEKAAQQFKEAQAAREREQAK